MWDILGISATSDLKQIKKAYAIALRKINPQVQAAEFQELKKAFDEAVNWAKQHPNFAAEEIVLSETVASVAPNKEKVEVGQNDFELDSEVILQKVENSLDSSLDWSLGKENTSLYLSENFESNFELESESLSLGAVKSADSEFNWTLGKEIPNLENSEIISENDFDFHSEGSVKLESSEQKVEDDWVLAEAEVETEIDRPLAGAFKIPKSKIKAKLKRQRYRGLILLLYGLTCLIVAIGMIAALQHFSDSSNNSTTDNSSISVPSSVTIPSLNSGLQNQLSFTAAKMDLQLFLPSLINAKISLSPDLYSQNTYYIDLQKDDSYAPLVKNNTKIKALGLDQTTTTLTLQQIAISTTTDSSSNFVKYNNGSYLTRVIVQGNVVAYVVIAESDLPNPENWQYYGTFWGDSADQLSQLANAYSTGEVAYTAN